MIWCVEDDASIRDIEVYALQSAGLEARGFSDGAAFWAALQKERPSLVVLDVMLPGEGGMTLLRRMRQSPALRQIPVVMATARDAEIDKIQGLDLGADYYLAKPFGSDGAGFLRAGGAAALRPPGAAGSRRAPAFPGRPFPLARSPPGDGRRPGNPPHL